MLPLVVAAITAAPVLPPIAFTQRTLPNGLRVVLAEDHRTPTVAINVAYGVGGKDDPPGKSGFAHLFEHLMFKGTANTKPEAFDRMTEDVGGRNNAYTAEDITDYHEVVPSNHLERLLWAEADRMSSLTVDQQNFVTEREVVIGEYDQRVLAPPYGMLSESDRRAYTLHPYKNGVIGDPGQLRAASLDDVRRFHATFYRPDNATLVIAGDFDPKKTNTWIDRYFGPVKKPAAVIPRVTVVEPPQTESREITMRAASAPLPALLEVFHTPRTVDRDARVLELIAAMLSQGPSSRLRQIVDRDRVAASASARAQLREQPGIFTVYAIAASGKTIAELLPAVDAEIAKLRDGTVGEDELLKAKTQLTTSRARSLETHEGVAAALASAAVVAGDPGAVNRESAELAGVTVADVSRVARRYLIPSNRTLIRYENAATPSPEPAK